jgi:phospholipid transport system substrate-binding protein
MPGGLAGATCRAIIALVGVLCLLQAQPAAADGAAATRVVESFGEGAIALLADPDAGPEERRARFARLVEGHLDLGLIGRIVLGPHWRAASEAEQAAYQASFETFIVESYLARIGAWDGEQLRILGSRPEGDRDVVVTSRIESERGPPVRVDWRLREGALGFRIIDVVVEGLSLAVTHRAEFGAVVTGRGGISGLIEVLEERTRALAGSSRAA